MPRFEPSQDYQNFVKTVRQRFYDWFLSSVEGDDNKERLGKAVNFLSSMVPLETGPEDLATPALFAGPKAKNYMNATRKFSNLADKMERFEISDEAMKLKNIKIPEKGIGTRDTYLADILDHPELFKKYPQLKDTMVSIEIGKELSNPGGRFTGFVDRSNEGLSNLYPQINIRARSFDEAKDTLIHEIQHAIQEYEGFARGGSPTTMWNPEDPFGSYRRLAGEIESRDAEFRRLYTDYERMTTQPGASQNIPLSEYIVNKGGR